MREEATALPDTMPPRRFEYADDKSYKFWAIALNGTMLTTRYGRIGNPGQTREVRFPSIEAAKQDYVKRIQQKTRAGYQERLPRKKKVVTHQEVWQRLADHEPFVQAILEDPDDIAGYAVYADWLVEREDPQGEFMQLQLALEDPGLPLYRRPKVQNAARLLRQRHVRHWLGNLAPWLMDYGSASHPYDFFRGHVSSIACYVLGLRFAHELRKSPHCRMLRELSIQSTEVPRESLEIDGRRYEANVDHGLEPLVEADFSNLREFRVGLLPAEFSMGTTVFTKTTYLLDLIESMPRLESLYLRAVVDLPRLLDLDLPHLTSLHLTLRRGDLMHLAESNLLTRLQSFGVLSPLTERLVDRMLEIPGFNRLSEFTCSEASGISDHSVRRLRSSGVVVNVLH